MTASNADAMHESCHGHMTFALQYHFCVLPCAEYISPVVKRNLPREIHEIVPSAHGPQTQFLDLSWTSAFGLGAQLWSEMVSLVLFSRGQYLLRIVYAGVQS